MSKPVGSFRQIVRRLARAPRFTLVAVLTLGAGIGATGAVFGVLNGVLIKPLPYPHPEQLVGVWHTAPGVNLPDVNMAPSNYFVYREQSRVFQDIGLYRTDLASLTGSGEPEQVPSLIVTDGLLRLLGVTPAAGRLFTRQDDTANAPPTAILSYAFWQKKYGGDPSIVGQMARIDNESRQVIGVLPRGFHFLDYGDAAVVMPFRLNRAETHLGSFSYTGVARLKPGVTIEAANADVARMLPIVLRSFPAPEGFSVKLFEQARFGPNLRSLRHDVVGDVGGTLGVLMACIAVVLLIACANVANLWLVRLEGRRREISVRSALGATRGRLTIDLLGECLAIGAVSGAVGLALAWAALHGLVALAPSGLPRLRDIGVDSTVVLTTFGLAAIASLLFGSIPIVRYAKPRANTGLRDSERSLSHSREQHRIRGALVVVQVALALVLLICSGLMVRTFLALTRVSPGFVDPAHLQTFRLYIPDDMAREADDVVRAQETVRRRLLGIPGVQSVAVSDGVPLDGNRNSDPVFAQDRSYREGELAPIRRFRHVLPGYFATLGTPFVAGRDITEQEITQHAGVAIVSRNLAAEYWGKPELALGKRIRVASTDRWSEIVGVVADVYDEGVSQKPGSTAYWPAIQEQFENDAIRASRSVVFSLRTPRAGSRLPRQGHPEDRLVGRRQSPAVFRADARRAEPALDGPNVVHAHPARRRRRHGAAARHRRAVRRHRLLGVAANARDRHPHGTWGAAGSTDEHVRARWLAARRGGRGRRSGRRILRRPSDVVAALPGERGGSGDLRARLDRLGAHVTPGHLSPVTPGRGRRSGGGTEGRLTLGSRPLKRPDQQRRRRRGATGEALRRERDHRPEDDAEDQP